MASNPYDVDVRTLQPGKSYSKNSGNPYDQWGADWLQGNPPVTKTPTPIATKPALSVAQPQAKVKTQPQPKSQPKQSLFGKIVSKTESVGKSIAKGVAEPFGNIGRIDVQGAKEIAAKVTGNKQADLNAQADIKKTSQGNSIRHTASEGAQALLTVATPEAKGVKSLAKIGGAYGAAQALGEKKLSAKEIAKQTALGTVGGVALGGVGHIVGVTAAKGIQKTVDALGYKSGFTKHLSNYVSHALSVADEAKLASGQSIERGMGKLTEAENLAKNPVNKALNTKQPKMLGAPSETKLLPEGKQNFTIQSQEDQRVMDGTEKLAKQYDKEYKQVTTAFANSPKRMSAEVDKLDQKYIGRHSDLINGVGEFAQQTKPTKMTQPSLIGKMKTENASPKPFPVQNTNKAPQSVADLSYGDTSAGQGREATKELSGYEPKITSQQGSTDNLAEEKVSGSALKSEQRAVEAGLAKEFKDKATYSSGSYKDEAAKAVQLVQDNPKQAMDIAMGRKPADNTIHEVAVSQALENKALKEGDGETLRQLATSPRHTATSEAAQRLGSEGYDVTDHSPIKAINQVLRARESVAKARTGKTVEKVASEVTKAIKAKTPSVTRQDWQSFVESLKC